MECSQSDSIQCTCLCGRPALVSVSLTGLARLFLGAEARGLGAFRPPAQHQTPPSVCADKRLLSPATEHARVHNCSAGARAMRRGFIGQELVGLLAYGTDH